MPRAVPARATPSGGDSPRALWNRHNTILKRFRRICRGCVNENAVRADRPASVCPPDSSWLRISTNDPRDEDRQLDRHAAREGGIVRPRFVEGAGKRRLFDPGPTEGDE